jgi:uncharacterized protein
MWLVRKWARVVLIAAAFVAPLSPGLTPTASALEVQEPIPGDYIWKPAPTPRGGVSWTLLESTTEITRTSQGVIYSSPEFPTKVKALAGKRVTVAGYMMPLEEGIKQRHFVLLAYPPGCPFHLHALPNQFIEVFAEQAVSFKSTDATIVSGVLELTGYDESGIFYRLRNARAERS